MTSFVLDAKNLSWSRLLVFVAFALLGSWRSQCVGFFAVVAGPIAALNYQALAARRWPEAAAPALDRVEALRSLGVILCVLTVVAVLSKTSVVSLSIDAVARALTGVPEPVAQTMGLPDPPLPFLVFAVFTGAVFLFAVGPVVRYLADVLVRWSLAGRLLTALLAVALLVMVWPGWLTAGSNDPYQARRVGWDVEPDASLTRTAETLTAWRRDGRLPPDARGFPVLPAAANHFAWFAPDEKGAFDHRYALFAAGIAEYAELRTTLLSEQLRELSQPPAVETQPGKLQGDPLESISPPKRAVLERLDRAGQFFERNNVRYVVLTSDQRNPRTVVGSTVMLVVSLRNWTAGDPKLAEAVARQYPHLGRWELLDMDGRTMLLSWHDPRGGSADPLQALYFDPNRKAFEAAAATDPLDAPPLPSPRSDPSLYIVPPKPRRLETDEALMHKDYFDITDRARLRAQQLTLAWHAGVDPAQLVTAVVPDGGPAATVGLMWSRLGLSRPRRESYVASQCFDLNSPAAPLLGIRAARTALRANPDDPSSYLRLATLYDALSGRTSERHWNVRGGVANTRLLESLGLPSEMLATTRMLPELGQIRRIQLIAAALQGIALAADGSSNPEVVAAHDLLVGAFEEAGVEDLAVKHRELALELRIAAGPEGNLPRDQFDEQVAAARRRMAAQKEALQRREGAFLEAVQRQKLGRAIDRAVVARNDFGLLDKALEIILAVPPDEMSAEAVRLQIELLLQAGRLDEVLFRWCGPDRRLRPELEGILTQRLPLMGGIPVTAFDWYGAQVAAVSGDYAEADRRLESMLRPKPPAVPNAETEPSRRPPPLPPLDPALPVVRAVGDVIRETLQPMPYAQFVRMRLGLPLPQQHIQEASAIAQGRAAVLALRGLLALENGDAAAARKWFREALPREEGTTTGPPSSSASQEMSRYYLDLCDRADR